MIWYKFVLFVVICVKVLNVLVSYFDGIDVNVVVSVVV